MEDQIPLEIFALNFEENWILQNSTKSMENKFPVEFSFPLVDEFTLIKIEKYLHMHTSMIFVATKHQNKNQIGNQSGQGQNGQNTGLQNILPSQDAGVPDLLVVAGDVSYGYRPYLYFPHFGRQPRPVLGAKHPDDKKLD